jgi:hypothetical protein
MRSVTIGLTVLTALVLATIVNAADARSDLRIKTEENEERYKVFKLANDGDAPIKATVELTKRCSGVSNRDKPKSTDYWIQPGKEIELGRAWAQSTCRRDYRVVKAEYL